MLLEAVRELSVFQLLSALSEKLSLERTRLREVRLPPVASVASTESEVSTPWTTGLSQQMWRRDLIANFSAREPRDQRPRHPDAFAEFPEHVAAGEQASARDPIQDRPMFPGQDFRRRKVNRSTNPRVPILARVYRLGSGKLDVDIQQSKWVGGLEP